MIRLAPTAIALALLATTAAAEAEEATIEEALSAAPPQLRDEVTVRDLDGTLLREGDGDFVCMPAPAGFAGPMCLDGPWMNWFQAYQAQEDFTPSRIGISYMLAGDTPDGGASNIDPYARTPTADNDWVVEGPHVMIIVPDDAILEGLPETPATDGPYVMWPDTPYAHIMLPVDARAEQRAIE
ncbi:MAG: hypothetical protein GVY33_12595 [Alphaproteobacteria bacterium]|jgi:hypothetical protein|nr:hypothetical protein [Alphaproteobacteria bacterium]